MKTNSPLQWNIVSPWDWEFSNRKEEVRTWVPANNCASQKMLKVWNKTLILQRLSRLLNFPHMADPTEARLHKGPTHFCKPSAFTGVCRADKVLNAFWEFWNTSGTEGHICPYCKPEPTTPLLFLRSTQISLPAPQAAQHNRHYSPHLYKH